MSPFSMARMSGLSLQSVWGTSPSISLRSSFSCIANDVKLYIFSKEVKKKSICTSKYFLNTYSYRGFCKWVYRTWAELAGLGAILHSSWLPGIITTVSEAAEGPSSWSSLQSCKQKTVMSTGKCTFKYSILLRKNGVNYGCLQRSFDIIILFDFSNSVTDKWCESIKQFILLCCFFCLPSLSCHFSYVLRRRQGRQHTDTPSTCHRAHTASFCCGKTPHIPTSSGTCTGYGLKKNLNKHFNECLTNWYISNKSGQMKHSQLEISKQTNRISLHRTSSWVNKQVLSSHITSLSVISCVHMSPCVSVDLMLHIWSYSHGHARYLCPVIRV